MGILRKTLAVQMSVLSLIALVYQPSMAETIALSPTVGLLAEHVLVARRTNPDYRSAELTLEVAVHGLSRANASLLPQLSLSSGKFRSDREEESQRAGGVVLDKRRIFSELSQIQLRQPVFRKGALIDVERAVNTIEVARVELREADQTLQGRILSIWLEILTLRELKSLQTRLVEAHKELAMEFRRRAALGEATRQDSDLAEASAIEAAASIDELGIELMIAEDLLRDAVNPKAFVPGSISMWDLLTLIDSNAPSPSRESVRGDSAALQRLRLKEAEARLKIEAAQSDRFPTLDTFMSASRGDNDAVSSVKNERRIGLQLSMPLFTSGLISSSVREAETNYRLSIERTFAGELEVVTEAVAASRRLASNSVKALAARKVVSAAELNVFAVERGLAAGVNSRAEVARAKKEFYAAQKTLILAEKARFTAWIRLLLSQSKISVVTEPVIK